MIYDIILNIEKSGIKPRIKVSQYDKTLPQIRATLYSNNQAFNIPSGSTVYISGTKKDNTGFKYECTYSDNVITADITEQMTAFSGDVEVEFTIESSGSRKGTENFILEVEKAALEDDVIISETDIPALQRLSQPATTSSMGVVKVDGTSVTVDEDGTLHSSGGGGGSVISVNGKTGVVVLDADDIDDSSTTNLFTTATEKASWDSKSEVSVTQIKSSGEKIATITVDGDDVDIYASAGGGGGGAVDSVNGKTGDVVLTASDVGALADNTPIPSDLSDLSDVDASGVTDGQILKYNATSGKFLPSNESGGGTSDYSQLSNKPSVNGVTLSGNKTSADLGLQSELTFTSTPSANNKVVCQNDLPSGGGSNPNLLDNPFFEVNQRGFTSATPTVNTKTYFSDRFYAKFSGTSGTIQRNSDGTITLTKNSGGGRAFIYQKIENMSRFLGKDMTLSLEMGDGTIYKVTRNTPTSDRYNGGNVENTDTHTLYIAFSYGTNYYDADTIFIELELKSGVESSVSKTIKAMKIEYGTESTLALDVAPNYATELLKCQRYFYPLGGKSYNAMVSAMQQTRQFMTITLPTEMRAVPTFSGSLTTEGISSSTRVENTVTSSNITVTKTQDIDFNFTTSSNYNLCSSARVSFVSGSYLSAEL